MKRLVLILLLLSGLVWAQQQATLSGIIKSSDPMPEGTRVAVFTVNRDNAWQHEIASATPVAGTFSLTLTPPPEDDMAVFRSGAVLFPGLTNEYTVAPDGARYVRGLVGMYVDANGNGSFDGPSQEKFFVGIASLTDPTGFFSLIYVDKAVTLSGQGVTLELQPGWNIFTVTYPQGGDPVYTVVPATDKALLDVYLP